MAIFSRKNGDNIFLRNIVIYLQMYTALQPRRKTLHLQRRNNLKSHRLHNVELHNLHNPHKNFALLNGRCDEWVHVAHMRETRSALDYKEKHLGV
jgi:hypothetical protein